MPAIVFSLDEAEERGIRKGMQEGKQLGMQEGKQLGMQEGKQLGLQKGKQLGLQKGKQEMAMRLLQAGVDEATIRAAAQMSAKELAALKKKLKN